MLLDASYQGTYLATAYAGKNRLFLTLMGGGAFANDVSWIGDAIGQQECINTIMRYGLQVTTIYHPDKIRKPGVGPVRNADSDKKLFTSLLVTYDIVNGTHLRSNAFVWGIINRYLDLAYRFQNDPTVGKALHEAAQQLNALLMWAPYNGQY
jgi:hypothetical protein